MLVAYTLEILPYKIRAKGFAVMNLTVFLTSAFNQFVNPWALQRIGWIYYVVYLGWLAVELLFIWFYVVETKGRTLEETAILFDGEDKREDLANMGGEAATVHLSRGIALQDRTRSDEEVADSSSEGTEKRRQSLALSFTTTESSMHWLKSQEVI